MFKTIRKTTLALPVVGRYSVAEVIGYALEGSGFELATGPGGALTIQRAPLKSAPALPLKRTGLVAPAPVATVAAPSVPPDVPASADTATVSGTRCGGQDKVDEDPRRAPTRRHQGV